jgi:carboxynorspermidine decarboxylase
MDIDLDKIQTPCYVVDETALKRNLEVLGNIQRRTGCKIIMALKGFAMFSLFPLVRQFLGGVAASSLNEARLGHEEFGKAVHVYSPAYKDSEFPELLGYAQHVVFNSFSQWDRFKPLITAQTSGVHCGIRVNPQHSEVKNALYDPCSRFSRLGVTRKQFRPDLLDGITGLHFHTLCELNADALDRTLRVFEDQFGEFLKDMRWVNFGGGHHITRKDYDIELLCRTIEDFKNRHPLEVYLEPGEAVALNTGVLVASVLDIIHNEMDIAILDTSAAAHMPDVLEVPYRPKILGAGQPGEYPYTYRLGGLTCLAGDVIGEYAFPKPLFVGSKLVLMDMAHYTMVKNNAFNGLGLPSIAIHNRHRQIQLIRCFGYEDYRNRLS